MSVISPDADPAVIAEIEAMLADYFEVLQSQVLADFDRIFHPAGVLYSALDGEMIVRPVPLYREVVANRRAPALDGHGRADQVLSIDVLSPEMAFAKVRLQLGESMMVDYLNLLKVDGRWQIVAKLYHREGPATCGVTASSF